MRRPEDRVEHRHRALGRHLRQPEHGLLAHFRVGIVLGDVEQHVLRLGRALLRDEKDRLAAQDDRASVAPREHLAQDRYRVRRVHLKQPVQRRDPQVVLVVRSRTAAPLRGAGLPRGGFARRLRVLGKPTAGLLVTLLGERGLDPGQQRLCLPHRGGVGVAALLGGDDGARESQVAGVVCLVERERGPVVGVPRAVRVRVAPRDVGEQIGGGRVVTAVERAAGGTPQRVGRVLLVLRDHPVPGRRRYEPFKPCQRLESLKPLESLKSFESGEPLHSHQPLEPRQSGCEGLPWRRGDLHPPRCWLLQSKEGHQHELHRVHHSAPCMRTGPGPAGIAVRSRSSTLRSSNPCVINCTSSLSPPAGS